jgi:aromatic ring-opening dioxygenase catalytic subunit (LigB family)
MASIMLGIGTSHMPGLNQPVEHWFTRAEADKRHLEIHELADYEELARERASWIGEEIKEEKIRERYADCQQALATLAQTLARARPDAVLVVGDDHREVFSSEHMPSMNVHWADSIFVPPFPRRNGQAVDRRSHSYPGAADLARHVVRSVTADQFEVSFSRTLPEERGLGHAFDFVCRRIMNGAVIPQVPVLLNTYYPPNRPTLKRCYEFGKALRRAVQSWKSDKRVAIIATGGLTHHIVDEGLDRAILSAMERKAPEDGITSFPEELFVDGTSEIKVWVVLAGVMAEGDLQMKLVNYSPCYRSPAGTGCGNAFAYWE